MAWLAGDFQISWNDASKQVFGLQNRGLGLHFGPRIEGDEEDRYVWNVTHLHTGLRMLILNVVDVSSAKDLMVPVLELLPWDEFRNLHDVQSVYPDWVLKLMLIKHAVGDDMEFPQKQMNDPIHRHILGISSVKH